MIRGMTTSEEARRCDARPEPMPARQRALAILATTDPFEKAAQARALFAGLDEAAIDPLDRIVPAAALPGRPPLPRLVPARNVPARSPFTVDGRAALLHAVAHIEFNAIKVALVSDQPSGNSFLLNLLETDISQ